MIKKTSRWCGFPGSSRQRARSCLRWAFCSSARKAAILRHLPAGLGQAEEDILQGSLSVPVSPTTPTPLSARVQTSAARRFVRQRGAAAGCPAGLPAAQRLTPLLLQDGCGFGCIQHPQQNATPGCAFAVAARSPRIAVCRGSGCPPDPPSAQSRPAGGWRSARWLRWSGGMEAIRLRIS